ncbi:transposase [Chryseobacterium sp. PBS4-4]|uniref:Transposase n=1 Tax=Chryseobacterium edaphi TaxID=2976532 RepID=A0ABT2W9G6_9FLAO|nr:transposase [Chryseobacterium edaphi]MCU7618852.1 transposase [Chryseobacterium edaphi]
MKINVKDIHIGNIIKEVIEEREITIPRICNFFKIDEREVFRMFEQKSLESDLILKWSKLAEYDFFRPYVTHLMLFASISQTKNNKNLKKSEDIQFRKNVYTKEIKEYILELVNTNQKTLSDIIKEYNIPKTTIYKWMRKQDTEKE